MRGLRTVVFSALLFLSGCATYIDKHTAPPVDWPNLTVRVHHGDGGEIIQRCYRYLPLWLKLLGGLPLGCALVDFERNECTIFVRGDYPDRAVLEHEKMHCKGYDHGTDSVLADAWATYKKMLLNIGGVGKD